MRASVLRSVAGSAALVAYLGLAACGGAGGEENSSAGGPGGAPGLVEPGATPSSADDLFWDVAGAVGNADVCGDVVVWTGALGRPEVFDTATGRVVVPEPEPPAGSDLAPDQTWIGQAGCVPTGAGPVVVVELGQPSADLDAAPPKLIAGFDAAGDQLWVREFPADHLGAYDGSGAIVVDEVGAAPGAWSVLDAATGETLAEGAGEDGEPLIALAADRVLTSDSTVVALPGGEVVADTALVAGAGPGRMLVEDLRSLSLRDVRNGARRWSLPGAELQLIAITRETADLDTGVAVVADEAGALVGVSLRDGRLLWTSEVTRDDISVLEVQVGSGVAVFSHSDDIDAQVVLDSATGERIATSEGRLLVGQDVLVQVGADGVPRVITRAELG